MLIVEKRVLNLLLLSCFCFFSPIHQLQHAKKVLSDILGIVDFAIRQVNSALILPISKWSFLGYWNYRRNIINPVHQNDFWDSTFQLQSPCMASCKNWLSLHSAIGIFSKLGYSHRSEALTRSANKKTNKAQLTKRADLWGGTEDSIFHRTGLTMWQLQVLVQLWELAGV